MRLTSKSRYAVSAMIDLGIKAGRRPVALVDVLDDEDISLSYLEQIFSRLKGGDLVVGVRGPRGGYHLAHPAEEITVGQIIDAVEERNVRARKSRTTGGKSAAHEAWELLSAQISDVLHGITLSQLLDKVDIPAAAKAKSTSSRRTNQSRTRAA